MMNFFQTYFSPEFLRENLQQIIFKASEYFHISYAPNDARSKENMIHWISKHFNIIKEAIK